ncbi:hypothetical protein HY495_03840 [Candidatus Woesearchaeota archaeon]|nr:hypothetical protein [Candidatus Woesearchaeota archaeon]
MSQRFPSLVILLAIGLFVPLLLLMAYFVLDNPILRMLSLALAVALTLLDFLYFPAKWPSSSHRLASRLDHFQTLLFTESLASLKQEYEKMYQHYEKLSERRKEKCYGPLLQIRGRIEDIIHSVKRLEVLAQQVNQGTLQGQQQRYAEMGEIYQRLPRKEQKQWYPQLRQALEILEKGVSEEMSHNSFKQDQS